MRSTRDFLVLLLAFTCASLAQAPAQAPSPGKDDVFRLEGRVINSITGQPIARALVQITTTAPEAMLTGPDGEFSFDHLPQATVSVQAKKPGFVPPGYNSNGVSLQKTVAAGPGAPGIVLKLTPEAVIYGQVTGNDDEPLEGVTVNVLRSWTLRGRQNVAPAFRTAFGLRSITPAQVQTDEDGKYRIAGLAPGTYYLMITTALLRPGDRWRPRAGSPPAKELTAYTAVVYYPGAPDFDSAMPVRIAGGQRVAADFKLKRVPSFNISGQVIRSGEWKQIYPPMITDEPSDLALFAAHSFSENGAFTFKGIPAGTYSVTLGGSDEKGMYRGAIRKLVVAGPITNLKLKLPSPVTVPVIVHNELTRPRLTGHCASMGPDGKMRTSDCSDQPLVAVQLDSAAVHTSSNSIGYAPQRDPNDLNIQGVMPGRYWVLARAQFGGYVAAVRSGSVDLMHDPLAVPNEGGVPPIEVTLRDDTAAVKVQVRSDTPGQPGWAILVPGLLSRDPMVLDLKSGTDRDYSGIAPGVYKVFAVDSMDGISLSDPLSYEKYIQAATSVTLPANGSATVSLELQHTGD